MGELVTRAELAQMARAEGLDVTERTIRYWAGEGYLPRPFRLPGQGTRAFYSIELLDSIRALVALRPANIKSLRDRLREIQLGPATAPAHPAEVEVGSQQFKVLPMPVRWSGQDFEYCLYTLADGGGDLLLLKKRR